MERAEDEPAQVGSPDGAPGLQVAREDASLREREATMRGLHEDPLGFQFADREEFPRGAGAPRLRGL